MPPRRSGLPGRKKNSACHRCRKQKIRCDNDQPCSNCNKGDHQCIRPRMYSSPPTLGGSDQRLQMLQEALYRLNPAELHRIINLTPSGQAPDTIHFDPLQRSLTSRSPGQAVGQWDDSTSRIEAPENTTTVYEVPNCAPAWSYQGPAVEKRNGKEALSIGSARSNNIGDIIHAREKPQVQLSPDHSTQIRPNEPLVHNVGLLSLANSHDPKYLGPSSGVPFARQFLSAISQSQGSTANLQTPDSQASPSLRQPEPFPTDWSFDVDPRHFLDAYLDTYQPFYPFLDESTVMQQLSRLWPTDISRLNPAPRLAEFDKLTSPMYVTQLLLVIALGARVLETRLSSEFHSSRYLATALSSSDKLCLHDNFQGIQIMLLLALCGLSFADGPSPWLLTSNIIAACLDLGFQRKWTRNDTSDSVSDDCGPSENVRRGIFWSAYSLERSLAVVLGRPLTLRDEAIDVEFPGGGGLSDSIAAHGGEPRGDTSHTVSQGVGSLSFTVSRYSFLFDQLTAEIKLMLYRVRQVPNRFPWLTDTKAWRQDASQHSTKLAADMMQDLKHQALFGLHTSLVQMLEFKYHQCLLLLHRPSPAEPNPSIESWNVCCSSASRILNVAAELDRFSKLPNTWLMAHSIFVSGITFLYCLWVNSEIREQIRPEAYNNAVMACVSTLTSLGKTWTVAVDALGKFERLADITAATWPSQLQNERPGAGVTISSGRAGPVSQAQGGQLSDGKSQFSHIEKSDTSAFWSAEQDQAELEPQLFFSELGDMSSCFDLDWIFDSTT